MLAASARSELILDGLLTLARCENQAIERLPVDLSDIAAGAVEETAAEAAAAGVTIDAALTRPPQPATPSSWNASRSTLSATASSTTIPAAGLP